MYGLHRSEFQNIVALFDGIADSRIYSCHIKDSSIPKAGDQISVTDLRLTGSLKEIFSAKQDAACMLEIDEKDNTNRVLNFVKSEQNTFIKCRAKHLANEIITISTYNPDTKELETFWEKVFLDLTA